VGSRGFAPGRGSGGRSPPEAEAFLHIKTKNPYHYIEGYEYISQMTICDFVTGIPGEVLCLLVPFLKIIFIMFIIKAAMPLVRTVPT
jgi:hypothetical protein